jgi:eukaryotic-like serine/threonine-protein kinase
VAHRSPDACWGHSRVEHLLGAGGMGVVYAARDVDLEWVVALKIVSSDVPNGQMRLRREAQRASRLNHPNVCTIHEVGAADGVTYFVMEHVDGQTLSALTQTTPCPSSRCSDTGARSQKGWRTRTDMVSSIAI